MRICIPTFLTTSQKAGIAFYTVNLVNALQEVDSENEYFLLVYEGNKDMFDIQKPNFHKVVIPFQERSRLHLRLFIFCYHQFLLERFVKRNKIDLIHIPSTWFVSSKISSVITIHDIVEFKTNRYSRSFSKIKQRMVKSAISNSKSVLTVSEFSKRDICSIGANPQKVFVTYNGMNKATLINHNPALEKEILEINGLSSKRYFIFIGTAQFHKNIPRLIQAFSLFNKEYKDFKLVLAGKKDNAGESIQKALQEAYSKENILCLDYINDETKDVLIKESTAFVFVSLHEGFGMPILEANRYRTPIIASNNSCLPEIAGNTALYVNPLDIGDICEKMKLLVEKPELRNEITSDAEENLKRFDWNLTARKTVSIYKESLL